MMMMTQITISKTKMTSKDLDMVMMMMTRKDLDMGGGKRTKCEESSNSTSSYKEAAECVALAIMIVTCLLSTMFMVITTKVIMIKKSWRPPRPGWSEWRGLLRPLLLPLQGAPRKDKP